MFYFDFAYFLYIAPAILLALWAEARVKSAYASADQLPTRLSGAEAARRILDASGLYRVGIELGQGHLSDHYDPRDKVLRLSPAVYSSHSVAAVGIAAHEAGHAIQDARGYAPLAIRNAAVPAANFGAQFSWILIILGFLFSQTLTLVGIGLFSFTVIFQLVNLPVEFDASRRAKQEVSTLGFVTGDSSLAMNKVLNAAAWTYIAATLQSVLTLLYLLMRFGGGDE